MKKVYLLLFTFIIYCSSLAAVAPITGVNSVCVGSTTTLSDASPGGSWSSSSTVASVAPGTGVVTGIIKGTTTITYTVGTGYATTVVTISPMPDTISTAGICNGTTVTMENKTRNGVWSVDDPSKVTLWQNLSSQGFITGITTGTITISYTMSPGCFVTRKVPINPAPSAISAPSTVCIGSVTTVSDTLAGGRWTINNGTSAATIDTSTGVLTAHYSGNVNILYSMPTGCVTYTQVTVASPDTAINGPANVCKGQTITLLHNIPGGIWSSGNTTVAATGTIPGSVKCLSLGTATITYKLSSCSLTLTKNIAVINTLYPISGPITICMGVPDTLTNLTGGGTWTSGATAIAKIDPITGTIKSVNTGTTTITYTAGACGVATFVLTVSPSPATMYSTNLCGGATATLFNTPSGGTWSSGDTALATIGLISGIITNLDKAVYDRQYVDITYTLPTGCNAKTSIAVYPAPYELDGCNKMAVGEQFLFTGPYDGVWQTSNPAIMSISTTGVATALSTGTVTISNFAPRVGCTQAMKNITVTPFPVIKPISGLNTLCSGTAITLSDSVAGGIWTSSNTAVATISSSGKVTGITPGTTALAYTTASAACIMQFYVSGNPAPIVGSNHICPGDTALYKTTNPYIYYGNINYMYRPCLWSWNSCWVDCCYGIGSGGSFLSSDTNIVKPVYMYNSGLMEARNPGTAVITYSFSPTGCTVHDTVTVRAPGTMPITGTLTTCKGGTTVLSDATPGGNWTSSNTGIATIGSTSGIVTGISEGIVSITYATTSACGKAVVSITISKAPGLITGNTKPLCVGQTIVLNDTTKSGVWTSGSTAIASIGSSTAIVTGISAGTTTISYSLPGGCNITTAVTVTPLPSPVTGYLSVCAGSAIALSDLTPSGVWSSSNSATATIDGSTGVVTGISSGTTTITYTLPAGCSASVIVTVNPLPSPVMGSFTMCAGSTTTLTDTTSSGVWSTSNTSVVTIDSLTGKVNSIAAGTTTITYTSPVSCMAIETFTVYPLPAIIAGTDTVCMKSTITLTATPSAGTWSSSDSTIASSDSTTGVITGVTTGTAVITYLLPTGCFTTTTIRIKPLPDAGSIAGIDHICAGAATTLSCTSGGGSWNVDDTSIAMVTSMGSVSGFGAGTAIISYTVSNSCGSDISTYTFTIHPKVVPLVNIIATPGDTVCAGDTVRSVATAINGGIAPYYEWAVNGVKVSTGADNYTYAPSDKDVLSVILVSSEDCPTPVTVNDTELIKTLPTVIPSVALSVIWGPTTISDQTDTIIATVLNGGSTPAYQWYVNGTVIPGATSDLFTAEFANNDSVSCEVQASGLCAYHTFNSVILNIHSESTANLRYSCNDIKLIPNPNTGVFILRGVWATGDEKINAKVTNIFGQVVYEREFSTKHGVVNESIQIESHLSPGMYLLNLHSAAGSNVFHFIKK